MKSQAVSWAIDVELLECFRHEGHLVLIEADPGVDNLDDEGFRE